MGEVLPPSRLPFQQSYELRSWVTRLWFSAPEGLTERSQGWSAAQPLAGVRDMEGIRSAAPPGLVGWLASLPGVALEDSLHPWLRSHAPSGLKPPTA